MKLPCPSGQIMVNGQCCPRQYVRDGQCRPPTVPKIERLRGCPSGQVRLANGHCGYLRRLHVVPPERLHLPPRRLAPHWQPHFQPRVFRPQPHGVPQFR
jgi:hypothetical protein